MFKVRDYTLKELEDIILFGNVTEKDWLVINGLVNEAIKTATKEEIDEFTISGAGDMLGQVLEYIDC